MADCVSAALGDDRPTSVRPWLLTPGDPFGNFCLECRRTERKPFVADLIDQASPPISTELHQPVQRLLLRTRSSRHHDVDWQSMPDEIRRQHDQVGFVGPHPIGQRACSNKPPADELPARMLRALVVDRAAVLDAERARLARTNLMAADLDPEPAIATGRAGTAASRVLRLHIDRRQACRVTHSIRHSRFARSRTRYATNLAYQIQNGSGARA